MTTPETVPAAGTIRRVQALAVAGWPPSRVAREAWLSPSTMARLMKATTVPAATARTIAAFYDRFSTVSPGLCGVALAQARAARARAFAAGWAPAGAWDDDTIDDPDARPDWTGHCGTTRGARLHTEHGIPLCPPCRTAAEKQQQRVVARQLRALSTHHA